MPYNARIRTNLHGRRVGLQHLTTGESGGAASAQFLVGPEDMRVGVTTAETTATNLKAFGISVCPGTSAGSSAVYTLEPPIPGVRKVIQGGTANGPVYIKTVNGETITTTVNSSATTVKVSSVGGAFELVGLTTAVWLGYLTSGTSSNASGFGLTTST